MFAGNLIAPLLAAANQAAQAATAPASRPATRAVGLRGSADAAGQSLKTLLNQLWVMWQGLIAYLPQLIIAFLVLVMTWLIARYGSRIIAAGATRAKSRPSLVNLLQQLSYIAIWVTGMVIAATIIFPGLNVGQLVATLGLTSIALGFAFKDIIENFLAGILILWRYPVEIGDYIEVDGIVGKVEDVTVRNTQLRKVDGDLVIIPNATLFKNAVNNMTNWRDRRTTIVCGIAYSENVDLSRDVIKSAVQDCKTIRKGPTRPVQVFAKEFADSSINFEVTWWTGSTPVEVRKSRDEVVSAVKRALDDAGIEIPFPYRTLTFKEPLHTVRQELGADGNGQS